MVHRKIICDLKEHAIFLLDHPEIYTGICEVQGVSLESVKRRRRKIWDFSNVHSNPNRPRTSRKQLNEEKIDQMVHVYYMIPSLLLATRGIQSIAARAYGKRPVTFVVGVGISWDTYSVELPEFGQGFEQRSKSAEVWPRAIRVFIYRPEYMCIL
jgi:hypothetical protein